MGELALRHRLYTHAATGAPWATTGGRFVEVARDAAQVLSPEARTDLDELLKKCVPSGEAIGYVVRRYAAASGDFACVIASYGNGIADAAGRSGLLNHARLVKVPENEALFDVAALVAMAETVVIDGGLTGYLELIDAEECVGAQTVSIDALQSIDRRFLYAFLAAHGRHERVRFLLPETELPGAAARAWAALPPALQRTFSWAVDVSDGCPVDAILSATEGRAPEAVASPALVELVDRYLDALVTGSDAILHDPRIATVPQLGEAVQRPGRWR